MLMVVVVYIMEAVVEAMVVVTAATIEGLHTVKGVIVVMVMMMIRIGTTMSLMDLMMTMISRLWESVEENL